MATNFESKVLTVAQSGTVSGQMGLQGGEAAAIWAPVVTSCQLFLRGSFDQTSANFVRLHDAELDSGGSSFSTDFTWNVGPGSKGLILNNQLAGFPYVKLETSVAQNSDVDFRVMASFKTR